MAADQRDRCQRCTASHDEVPHITVICQARSGLGWAGLGWGSPTIGVLLVKYVHGSVIIMIIIMTMNVILNHHLHT